MTTLDHPTHPDPNEVAPWPTAIRYGLIGGLILIIYSFLGNLLGFGRPSAGLVAMTLFGLSFFAIYIGLIFLVIRKHRDEDLGGYITLGRSVIIGVATALIAGIISSIYSYVYINFIDPNILTEIMEEAQVMFEEFGMEEEMIDEQLANMERSMDPATQFTQGLMTSVFFGGVVSLITGAIMKKNPPEEVA